MGSKNNIYSTANFSDSDLKDQGNRLFSVRKYDDAISCYTKAIVSKKQPHSTLFMNCFRNKCCRSKILQNQHISQIALFAI